MKLFTCQHCSQVLYFENVACEKCGHALGYIPETNMLSALEPVDGGWQPLADPVRTVRFCANARHGACNWLVTEGGDEYCAACRHNRVVPDLAVEANVVRWRALQLAGHRLFYTLLHLGLPLRNRIDDLAHGLLFDVLADTPEKKVLTGHDEGVITLALAEGDDAERERRRVAMGEPYRTLLGHFRHEIGHYYWDVLVRDAGKLDACRAVFGDETPDYGAALAAHYANGAPADWQDGYVSAYATAHPWEDFAETWAHYLHIMDTLEMAESFGLRVRPKLDVSDDLTTRIDFDPYKAETIETLVDAWLPLTFAVNSLNRCMGATDLYPFILSRPAIAKLGFVHDLVQGRV